MPPRYTPPSTRHIRRIDSRKSHGYQVHVERDGKVITKHFSDSRYPSPAQARKAAMAYRDQVLAEVPPPRNRLGYRTVAHSNTGEVGISLTTMTRRRGDKKPYITVSVSPEPGKMLGRKFSVERYGYEGAVAEAKAWREEVLRKRQQQTEAEQRRRRAKVRQQPEPELAPILESLPVPDSPQEDGATSETIATPESAQVPETVVKRRGRKPKQLAQTPTPEPEVVPEAEAPAKRRGRKPKQAVEAVAPEAVEAPAEAPAKRRGRKPKQAADAVSPVAVVESTTEAPAKRRGRKPKAQ